MMTVESPPKPYISKTTKGLEHRLKHLGEGGYEIGGSRGGITTVKITKHSIMDHYLARRLITDHEYDAGDRVFRDFTFSGQTQGITSHMGIPGTGGEKLSESQMEARQRWRDAINSVGGRIGQLMILNVCCYGYGLNEINYINYNKRSSWDRFHEALDDLMKHYNGENA